MDVIIIDIPTIPGNSALNAPFQGKILLNSYSHSVSLPMATDAANNERTMGKPNFSEMSFSKVTDKSTPMLYAACAKGQKLGKATVSIGRNENGNFMELLKYELENAMVSSITTSGGGNNPNDSFSLNFTGIKTYYTQQNADSTKAGVADFGWDLKANAAA